MINREEIEQKSEELDVHVSNVQRDYVFGWLLAGIFQPGNPLGRHFILKGGNAFRKAYFPSARFSTDLDFSIQTELKEHLILEGLKTACVYAREKSGVEFHPENSRIREKNLADKESSHYEARVYFKSFYGDDDINLKVELDIKEFDRIFLPVQTRGIIHDYSDHNLCKADLRCQKLEELLASKLKALLQRRHSPDLYDFVYSIFFQKVLDIHRGELIKTFLKKTIYEPTPQIARGLLLDLPFQILRGFWNQYLVCPKLSSISFDDAEVRFRSAIEELFGLIQPQPVSLWNNTGINLSYFTSSHREKIMEGGRLTKMLRLVYDGFERLVEPYALTYKRRKDGVAREYFYAWDLSGGRSGQTGIKSFIADKIQSIQITEQSFDPRFPIELVKGGSYFSTDTFPTRTRRLPGYEDSSRQQRQPIGRKSFPTFAKTANRMSNSPLSVTYTIECPYCGKRFKRRNLDTKLNTHKDQFGNRCFGRIGVIV